MIATDFIDVSSNQLPAAFDWSRISAAGVLGAMIRTAYGSEPDRAALAFANGVREVGRDFGAYGYPIPRLDHVEAEAQADAMLDGWNTITATIAPAVDWEASANESPLVAAVSRRESGAAERLADWIDAFMEYTARHVRPIIYTGSWWNQLPRARAARYRDHGLWVASYTRPLPVIPWPWDEYLLWQHSANTIARRKSDNVVIWGQAAVVAVSEGTAVLLAEAGKVDGAPGEVDCSALGNASLDDLRNGRQPRCPLNLDDIRDRQRALRRLGYDCGALDGAWGPSSRAALVMFQRDAKVPTQNVGVWTGTTQWAIEEALGAIVTA